MKEADAKSLAEFLARPARPEGTLRLHELQGFLFAIACSPETIAPSDWLPLIGNEESLNFSDENEAQAILGLVMALYNEVNTAVLKRSNALPAGCAFEKEISKNFEDASSISQWSRGFASGHGWLTEVWEEYLFGELDEECGATLLVLSFFGSRQLAKSYYGEMGPGKGKRGDESFEDFAETMRRMFPDALASYANIGRSIFEAVAEQDTDGGEPAASRKIGRNEPCPCGSGKKYKKCCLGRGESDAPDPGASKPSEELRLALQNRQFASMTEAQAFAEDYMQQRNQKALDEFHGLTPEHMHHMLHFPFASPALVCFPEILRHDPAAPMLTLFRLLADAIGEQGLKPTAKGNLPRNFCREAAFAYWGEKTHTEKTRFSGINKEEDFFDMHVVRLVAELSGLLRKYKGKFILSRDCRRLLSGSSLTAIYPRLLATYVQKFNWAYWDRYDDFRFIQTAFLFTLYLLTCNGDSWLPHEFYEDSFLRAFPAVMDEAPESQFDSPDKQVRTCYTWRTLVHFADFLGLAAVEPVSNELFCRKYRIKALPLLRDAVQFRIAAQSSWSLPASS